MKEEENFATPENLKALRKAVSGSEEGLPHHDDVSLSRFLFAKKTVEKATKALKSYEEFMTEMGPLSYSDSAFIIENGLWCTHHGMCTKEGAQSITQFVLSKWDCDLLLWPCSPTNSRAELPDQYYMWGRPGKLDMKKLEISQVQKGLFWFMDHVTRTLPDINKKGMVLIIDWTGFSLGNFNLKLPPAVLKIMQDIMPLRIKRIIHINQPFVFSIVFGVIKPLLGQKLRSRLKMLGDPAKLTHFVELPQLPTELGGQFDVSPERIKKEVFGQ